MLTEPSKTVVPSPDGDRASTSNTREPKGRVAVWFGVIDIVNTPDAGLVKEIPPLVVLNDTTTGEVLSKRKSDFKV